MSSFRLAHLSDLHFGRSVFGVLLRRRRVTFDDTEVQAILTCLRDDVKPSVVVITGDLVDSPRMSNFREARTFIEALRTAGYRVVVCPGNHDVRGLGIFTYGILRRFFIRRFNKLFGDVTVPFESPDHGIVVESIDSTKRGQLARGHFPSEDLLEIHNRRTYLNEHGLTFRIALAHHHTLPVLQGETGALKARIQEPSLGPVLKFEEPS